MQQRRVSFRESQGYSSDGDIIERLPSDEDMPNYRNIDRDLMIVERNSESSTEIMPTEEGGLSDQDITDFNKILRSTTVRPPTVKLHGGAGHQAMSQALDDTAQQDDFGQEEGAEEAKKSQRDLEMEMLYKSILHMAKKNLMFELEYIQAVCEHFESGAFPTQHRKKKSANSDLDNSFLRIIDSFDGSIAGGNSTLLETTRILDQTMSIKQEDSQAKDQKKKKEDEKLMNLKKSFLLNTFQKLEKLRRKYLKSDAVETVEMSKLHQMLLKMASYLEVSRLCLDNYIYPRDLQLNLIDVQIEENNVALKKKEMHLTERLYTIEYKDFFSAYEKIIQLNKQITKIMDLSKQPRDKGKAKEAVKFSDEQNQQLLESGRKTVAMVSKNIDVQNIVDHGDDTKKHATIAKSIQSTTEQDGVIKAIKAFYPNAPPFKKVEDVNDSMEFTLAIKIISIQSKHTDLQIQLMEDAGKSFSLKSIYEPKIMRNDKQFLFVNIPIRALLWQNLSLLIKFIIRRQNDEASDNQDLKIYQISPKSGFENKYYLGFTILPISKIFWLEQLQVQTLYENTLATVYNPPDKAPIEEKYVSLLDKKAFKRLRNPMLTQYFNLAYQFQLEPSEPEDIHHPSAIVVRRDNFDQHLLESKLDEKAKLQQFRQFNDFKIELSKLNLGESQKSKIPIMRIEVALRDDYGNVYDRFYQNMSKEGSGGKFNFKRCYESLIYAIESNKIKLTGEIFFVSIPTKNLDTLKKLYLIFMLQFPVQNKDAKGQKIKSSNFMNEMETLAFQTEMIAVLSLYDFQHNCVRQNVEQKLDLYHVKDPKKSLPTRCEYFKLSALSNLKICENEHLKLTMKLVSNEFTHNAYINNLLMLNDLSIPGQDIETILKSLKNIKDSPELVLFHEKIFNKLFKLLSDSFANKFESPQRQESGGEELTQQIFDSIILLIDMLTNRSAAAKEILNNYLKDSNNPRAYKPLLYQVEIISQKIKEGLVDDNQERNACILMAMKYLGSIFKYVRNSFLEALAQHESAQGGDRTISMMSQSHHSMHIQESILERDQLSRLKQDAYNKDMILEEDEDSDDEFVHHLTKSHNQSHVRKQAMRQTVKVDALLFGTRELSKGEFSFQIQKVLRNIFEGCHKDELKNTISLRAILYENVSSTFENVADFMNDQFMQSVFCKMYDEKYAKMAAQLAQASKKNQEEQKQLEQNKKQSSAAPTRGILKKGDEQKRGRSGSNRATDRRSEITTVNGMSVAVDNDYMKQDSHIKALHEYSHMNEESITKLKIISMGDLLANGVFDKVQGDTNKIVLAFCENIEKFHLKRSEMNFHVFYFLYQLFQYLKSSDDLSDTLSNLGSYRGKAKLIVFSKKSLDLGNFFTKILPDVMNNMKFFLTDSKIEDHFKKARLPEGILTPFKEKVSLVFLSILNAVTRDRIKFFVFNEPKKLILILNQLKELVGRISFVEPYALFFEKKKTQVYRKIIQFIIELFMDSDPSSFKPEYHQSVYQCRLMMLYLWNKLAKIKLDYKKTTRYQALVKDQLKVHKGKMLHIFKQFWDKYKHVGQPWTSISGSMTKQFEQFIILSEEKAIKLVVDMLSDSLTFEFKSTNNISETTSSVFKVYYQLNHEKNTEKQGEVAAMKFYYSFQNKIVQENQLFNHDIHFRTLIEERFEWMKLLASSLKNVKFSKKSMPQNIFYRAYCVSQLDNILYELKLFKIFQENFRLLEELNSQLENTCENGYLQLMFTQVLEKQNEQKRKKLGDRHIQAQMRLQGLSYAQKYFYQAQFFQKAIEILNQQKDIAEKQLFDFSKVSQIVQLQLDIYEKLSVDQERHYASHFKVGFFGMSFPEMLRNKEFILRIDFYKKRADVKEFIQRYFPDAFSLEYSNYPDKNVLQQDKQQIQIQAVNPFSFVQLKEFDLEATSKDTEELEIGQYSQDLPPKLKIYYMENFKNKFYKETLIESKARKDGDDFQKDRMIEIFTVKYKYPTIFNLQEIVTTEKVIRNAFDEAIRSVQQLTDLINEIKKKAIATQDTDEFVDLRNKTQFALRSPIQGGVERFLTLFMTDENLRGPHKEKTIRLFQQIEKCQQCLFDGIQALQSFMQEEVIMSEIFIDYANLKEKISKIRTYIDSLN